MNKSLHHLLMVNHNLVQNDFFKSIEAIDLSLGQPKILEYLRENDGAIQKDIAKACVISEASISNILRKMKDKGLIEKVNSKENKRKSEIYLTDKSKDLLDLICLNFNRVDEAAMRGFDREEKKQLEAYLLRIYDNLRRTNE